MDYTLSSFKSLVSTTKEFPSFHKSQVIPPEMTPDISATIARMCSKATAKLTSSQKNIGSLIVCVEINFLLSETSVVL